MVAVVSCPQKCAGFRHLLLEKMHESGAVPTTTSASIDAATKLEIRVRVKCEVEIIANNHGVCSMADFPHVACQMRALWRWTSSVCVRYAEAVYVPESGDLHQLIND